MEGGRGIGGTLRERGRGKGGGVNGRGRVELSHHPGEQCVCVRSRSLVTALCHAMSGLAG